MKKKKEQILGLTQLELYKIRAHEAEARASLAEAQLLLLRKELYLEKIDPEGQYAAFERDIKNMATAHNLSQQKYMEAKDQVEKRLQIQMKDFSYDDETGVLMPHTEEV